VDIELPSGNKIVVRDKLRPGDRFAVQDAPDVIVQADKTVVVRNATANTLPAFLARVIVSWTFPGDPKLVLAAGARGLDDVMDLDDWDALEEGVKDLLEKARPEQPDPNSRRPLPGSSPRSEITSG
jgi:hypothetical protein